MHFSLVLRRLAASVCKRESLPPLVIGLGLWIGFPTVSAYQDMVSFVSGMEANGPARWNAVVEKSVAGSVHKAEMKFLDSTATGSISGSGVRAGGLGAVAFEGNKAVVPDVPDEERINREEKRGRVVNVAPAAPPKSFNAGSVFQRSSLLRHPLLDNEDGIVMAFDKPAIEGKEVQIASAFHMREDRKDPGVPTMLASLVTNDKADILATAYAPAKPDYAKASPFASLLKGEEDANAGRFVPPVGKGDHDWMAQPLPPVVFSKPEQKCLAAAVYFEARSEHLKGQAAVAQVVLNRVRNPAYPNTICKVVYQNDDWRNRCQFSFACDGIRDRIASPRHWKVAQEIAMAVTAGKIFIDDVGSSTHYHAVYVRPRWARTMEKMKKIGLHVFYRTYGGGWS
ncbi:cell wall hydrolase [Mesorhizobium xinjiangense]|uniref:cell wall hydrolase n=1 Tax=Mesorhizobium xinjiangense TaxID=2678685 RepID=UPI0012EE4BA9|nr:cell wall hydrolase [Mesorhizobium xinjiangense]